MALSDDPAFAFRTDFMNRMGDYKSTFYDNPTPTNTPNYKFDAQDFKDKWLENRFDTGRTIVDHTANDYASTGAPVTTSAADGPTGPGADSSASSGPVQQNSPGNNSGVSQNVSVNVNTGGGRRQRPAHDRKIDTRPQDQIPSKPVEESDGSQFGSGINYDFGSHDALAHGPGAGFGLYDINHMLSQGASEENIKRYAQDYQASGGLVGSIAASRFGMEANESGPIAGANTSLGLGAWWTDRNKGKDAGSGGQGQSGVVRPDREGNYPIKDEYQQGQIERGDERLGNWQQQWHDRAGDIYNKDMEGPVGIGQSFDVARHGYNVGGRDKYLDHDSNVKNRVAGLDMSVIQDRHLWDSKATMTQAETFGDVANYTPAKWLRGKDPSSTTSK